MIVNSLEELRMTMTLENPEANCGFSVWIGGTTNTPVPNVFDYSSSPDQYLPDNSGMYTNICNSKVYRACFRLNRRGNNCS